MEREEKEREEERERENHRRAASSFAEMFVEEDVVF